MARVSRSPSSSSRPIVLRRRPAEDDPAVGHDLDDVGRGGREDRGVLVAAGAGGAGCGGVEGDQVGALADRDGARVVVPEAGVAVGGGRPQQLGRGPVAALPGGEPLVELDRAHLLEQVDDRVAVGAEGERAAGARGAPGSGRRRRRGRARWWGRSRRRSSWSRGGRCRRRSGGWRARRWSAGRGRRGRRAAGWGWRRTPRRRRRSPWSARRGGRGGVCRWLPRRPCGAGRRGRLGPSGSRRRRPRGSATRSAHGVGGAVAEPSLHALRRLAEPAAEVAGVEQPDPQARLPGPPRRARGPWRWGRRTASRRAGGAGSGTPPRW